MNDKTHENEKPAIPGAGYLAVIGALVVVIMISLAVLWMTERLRRDAAEVELTRVKRKNTQLGDALTGGFISSGGPSGARPVVRDDLPQKYVTLDGRRKSALLIGASAGKRFGFQPGDVIIVSQAQTRPATASAPAGGDTR